VKHRNGRLVVDPLAKGRAIVSVEPKDALAAQLTILRHRLAVLWLLLLGVSAIIILATDIPVAGPNRELAATVGTLAGVVGLALLYLSTLRFLAFGRPLDLCVGLAFGTLALANLLVRIVAPAVRIEPPRLEVGLYLLLVLHAVAALLFFIPLLRAKVVVEPRTRRRYAAWLMGGMLLGITVIVVGFVGAGDRLPPAIGPSGRQLIDAGAIIWDVLPGQAPWLMLVTSAITVIMFLATLGYSRRSEQLQEGYLAPLTVALTLLSFGQFYSLLFPPVALTYVSVGTILRLAAYLVLLYALVRMLGRDIVERAGRQERLRLSRDLHDGLMQQLSLLNLRLDRASAPTRSPQARTRDLEAAQRVLEGALLEARQAIIALRSGTITWEEFAYAVDAFVDEFAANHGVAVLVSTHGKVPALDAELQGDVLRILHEAFSNAIRHGRATQLEVTVGAQPGRLVVRVEDDGCGFDPGQGRASGGIGLRSQTERVERRGGTCTITSCPGAGTTVQVAIPL
jgi:signal transduction histidine kinase